MFRVEDLRAKEGHTKNNDDDDERQSLLQLRSPAFLKYSYSKAASVCSTESSLSTCTDQMNDFSDDGEEPLLGEDILDSIDEDYFFDCVSHEHDDGEANNSEGELVAMYVDRKCVYPDGRPAYVPPGNCTSVVSANLIDYCGGDLFKAQRMWKATLTWRQEHDIWKIHTKPNGRFHHAKAHYPSCYHGYSKSGLVVEYSFPGKMNANALLPSSDVVDEMLFHHYYQQEYISNCLYDDAKNDAWFQLEKEPPGSCGIVIVIDVKGAGPHLLTSKVLSFLKQLIVNNSAHYPTLADRCLIVNAPFWVGGVFATLRPLLPDSLPVEIVSEQDTLRALGQYIEYDQIPKHYGGSNAYELHQHPFEQHLHQFVDRAGELSGSASHLTLEGSGGICCLEQEVEAESSRVLHVSNTASSHAAEASCWESPLRGILWYPGPKFKMVNEPEHLTLSPRTRSFDILSLANNFLNSLVHGFLDCSGHNNDQARL